MVEEDRELSNQSAEGRISIVRYAYTNKSGLSLSLVVFLISSQASPLRARIIHSFSWKYKVTAHAIFIFIENIDNRFI